MGKTSDLSFHLSLYIGVPRLKKIMAKIAQALITYDSKLLGCPVLKIALGPRAFSE